jgi:ubiquinone/menaquinone biosynthesis C-methylase UbiE
MNDDIRISAEEQRRRVVEQFTRQAVPFSQMPAHSHEESNRLVLATVGIGPDDTVLDVACGPGLITCEIARVAGHVTGIDITPAMIEQAQARQRSMGLTNMAWQIGDVQPLPFADAFFSLIFTRYSFHHFLAPQGVLGEMMRVCKPGGKVAVVDVFASSAEQAKEYDHEERLRDPSHVRTLFLEELTGLFKKARLLGIKIAFYKLEVDLEDLLASSFPNPGDADGVRHLFQDDLGVNRMGFDACRREGRIHIFFPIVIVAGCKAEVIK